MIKEFKKFIMRGNVLDLAIGIVIGGAFGTIIKSFVNDILMPPIGLLLGGTDFSSLFINLSGTAYETLAAAQEAGAATLNYGVFLQAVINFLIVSFAIFMIIRAVNKTKRKEEAAPAAPTTQDCPFCKMEIAIEATRCSYCTSQLQ